ncbi:MAG: efflux RND transporter permease subunit [Dehalococcoidia bacterium]|nr:efflux RND transporter permease subunit [Dehalococcoidia bacterium]
MRGWRKDRLLKITEFSLRNPLVVVTVTMVIVIFGLLAYTSMGVAITPNINFPAVVVTTVYPGADPETVEADVTRPIEDAVAALPNINPDGLISTSSPGVSSVFVQFSAAVNPDLVSVDVGRVVAAARAKLPLDADSPIVTKIDFSAQGVATIVFSGQQPLTTLQDVAENTIQKRLAAVAGVGAVNIRSGITREVHIRVDEQNLAGRGLSINNVINALQTQQLEVPAGTITQGNKDYSVYFDALASSASQLGDLVLTPTPQGAVRLKDVATIDVTSKKRGAIVRVNGQEGLALVVVKLQDTNTITVVNAVKQAIKDLESELPENTQLDVVVDASTYTSKSSTTLQKALLEAVLFTAFMLLLFLHTWRSTLIVLVSIPTSLLATLGIMAALHYNLNLLTMMALTVSVGILVDDSIVVLENITRHLAMGKKPYAAALDGRAEIGLAALTITFVDVVVYLPIAVLLSGIPGEFLRPFSVTIGTATVASLLVSFTVAPLLASRLLTLERHIGASPWARFGRLWDRGFFVLENRYEWLLRVSLPRRWAVIALGVFAFASGMSLVAFGFIKYDFFPSGDQSEIDITLLMPSATTLEATNLAALAAEAALRDYAEVRSLYTLVGGGSDTFTGGTGGSNQAMITALLVPHFQRHRSSAELGLDVRDALVSTLPDAKVRIGLPNAFGFGGFGAQPIQVRVQGPDSATLTLLAAQVEQAVRSVPTAASVNNSNDNVQTQIRAKVDWNRAADLGVSPQSAGAALRASLDGFRSSTSHLKREGQTAVDIRVLSSNAGKATVQDIASIPISGSRGIVHLGQFAQIQQAEVLTAVTHINRQRSVLIGAEPARGHAAGDAQISISRALRQVTLPKGYSLIFTGQGQQGNSAIAEIFRGLGVAVVLMYMLMMMLFGSVTLPFAVLMSLPLALVGAFGAMAITQTPFTLFALLGFAVLVGLVGKNAILLVDYTEILRGRGYERNAALLAAGPIRLRPIVMTTVSIIAALLPIASGLEEGAELLQAAAVVLIGGLLTSTLLTLIFVPAMYTVFDDIQNWVLRRLRQDESSNPQQGVDASGDDISRLYIDTPAAQEVGDPR